MKSSKKNYSLFIIQLTHLVSGKRQDLMERHAGYSATSVQQSGTGKVHKAKIPMKNWRSFSPMQKKF